MKTNKQTLFNAAMLYVGIDPTNFGVSDARKQSMIRMMDQMVASWRHEVRIPYQIHQVYDTAMYTENVYIDQAEADAISLNFALKLAPIYGRQALPATQIQAAKALRNLINRSAVIDEYEMPNNMIRGSGFNLIDRGAQSRKFFSEAEDTRLPVQINVTPTNGGTVTVTDGSRDYDVRLTPATTLSTMNIVMPSITNAVDLQRVSFITNKDIYNIISLDGNGAGFVEPIANLITNDLVEFTYTKRSLLWVRTL